MMRGLFFCYEHRESAADVGAPGFHVNGVKRGTARQEQPVALAATKRDIGNDFPASATSSNFVDSSIAQVTT